MSDKDEPTTDPEIDVDPDPADDDKDWRSEYEGARKVNRDLERKTKKDLSRIQQLEADLAEARKGTTADGDKPDPEEIRKQARAEAQAEVLRERVLDRIEAKAAKLFADPEDAVALLARRAEEFIDDGKVDSDAIADELAELLKKKPHLAAEKPARFQGGADGGARKGSKPDQLTRDDLKNMTPRQIEDARTSGRLNDLMGIN